MTNFWQHFLNFIFPVTCAACGAGLPCDDYFRLCASCESKIKFIEDSYCLKCGIPLPDGGAHCFHCRKNPPYHFECIRSACSYEGVAKELLHKFKYGHRDYLDRILSKFLSGALERHTCLKESELVMAVPMHPLKKLIRGYNQAELLAKKLAFHLGKPVIPGKLNRKRFTRAQYNLTREERIANLEGSFVFAGDESVRGKTVLLVDDICTTGTTIEQCAMVLRRSGAKKVFALTVARD